MAEVCGGAAVLESVASIGRVSRVTVQSRNGSRTLSSCKKNRRVTKGISLLFLCQKERRNSAEGSSSVELGPSLSVAYSWKLRRRKQDQTLSSSSLPTSSASGDIPLDFATIAHLFYDASYGGDHSGLDLAPPTF